MRKLKVIVSGWRRRWRCLRRRQQDRDNRVAATDKDRVMDKAAPAYTASQVCAAEAQLQKMELMLVNYTVDAVQHAQGNAENYAESIEFISEMSACIQELRSLL
ncbi:MAG: hypothetical protein P8176_12090, partial [Gammaproteobacteria bacterium]